MRRLDPRIHRQKSFFKEMGCRSSPAMTSARQLQWPWYETRLINNGLTSMIVQIYEVTSAEEANALGRLGVDHIGVLVGDGTFPREQSIEAATRIFSAVPPSSKGSALSLSPDLGVLERIAASLRPAILHLGASTDLLFPAQVRQLKRRFGWLVLMRSIPVVDEDSIAVAQSYDGIADILLLDSHRAGDRQIGALGLTHSWELDRRIVEAVTAPVIIAGGLGPENVVDAIRTVCPAGIDSKTKTDKTDGSHSKDLARVERFVSLAKSCCRDRDRPEQV
jgi:phosphoribosylanthranilate isomerase